MWHRTPMMKLVKAGLIALVLVIPLLMIWGLVSDRQHQARVAQQSIETGWAGPQTVSGPIIAIPYNTTREERERVNGREVVRNRSVRSHIYLTPERHDVSASLEPSVKRRAIHETVIYLANLSGEARYALPEDLSRLGVSRGQLLLDQAELRFGVSDPRGLQDLAEVSVNGDSIDLQPGNGLRASNGGGFFAPLSWDGQSALSIRWSYAVRGSRALDLVPNGGLTTFGVSSAWPHPSFGGSFLPDESEITAEGFSANWSVGNLALNQPLALAQEPDAPALSNVHDRSEMGGYPVIDDAGNSGSKTLSVRLIDPVDVYSQVDRSVKYGFLFIGFTFLAFLLFDLVAGAKVATAEYLLTGAGLVLFFVMLLAFAEVIGFALAYVVASAAIIGLLTAYSAAVLASWKRAGMIAGLLVGLYAALYVLLSLEAWSLVIGSLMLFGALAAVMFATRKVDWSGGGDRFVGEAEPQLEAE